MNTVRTEKKPLIAISDKLIFDFIHSMSNRELYLTFINGAFRYNLEFIDAAYYHFNDSVEYIIKDIVDMNRVDIGKLALRNRLFIESYFRNQVHEKWLKYEDYLRSDAYDPKVYEEIGLFMLYNITERFIHWLDLMDMIDEVYDE